jgi:hypothetical protein
MRGKLKNKGKKKFLVGMAFAVICPPLNDVFEVQLFTPEW